jgi:arylsulfatase A-like enzyme
VAEYFDPLPAEARTIAHEMREKGYATAFFGKWHLGVRDPAAPLVGEAHARTIVPPERRGGFDFWEGFESGFLLNDPLLHGTRLPEPVRFSGYQSEVLAERAGDWMSRTGPWFCVVSLESPHPPYAAPSAGIAPLDPMSLMLSPNVPPEAESQARRELAGYYAHIEATDRAIGRLVRATDAAETAVVFTSVHGDMHGAHGLFRKGWPHEESVRVPLLIRWPGERARREEAAVSLLHVAELTIARMEHRRPGIDPRFARISMPSVVALPRQCDRVWRGLRSAQRKLILNADGTPWLYFNLERDPGEQENLVADPACAAEIAAWRTESGC